ncbi:hypothetical protein GCM10010232_17190 [Streptomyces amakusaensis]|uniref:Secreted protein n=1 Tax=Streptomyces amakusaensis TaxID=67271 RepID=A0ABW0AQ68_9ACTN
MSFRRNGKRTAGAVLAVVVLVLTLADSWIAALLTLALMISAVVGWFMLRAEYGDPGPLREAEPRAPRDTPHSRRPTPPER